MAFYKSSFLNQCFAIFVLACALCGCQPAAEKTPLAEPPPLILDGYETAVVEQIRTAQSQWEKSPLSAQANGDLAMLLHTYLQHSVATVYYQRARALNPEEFRWAYLHGLVLAKLGERDEAILALRHAVALDDAEVPATLKLAQLLDDSGQSDESQALYNELLSRHPDLPQAMYGLGKQLLKQGDDTGLNLLQSAVNRKGPYGAAHYALAEAYRQRGESAKADKQLELFEKFRTTVPSLTDPLVTEVHNLNESKQGLINRGQRMIGQGRGKDAIKDFELALSKDPSAAGPHSLLIVTYGMMGKFDEAESHYRQGVELDPELAQLHNNFGTLRMKQGRYDEAAQAFREAISVDPDYLDAYVNLGAALETNGKRSEAMKQYKTVVERDPLHRAAGFHLGNAYMKMSNPHRAVEQYLRILEPQDRNTPEYLQALAVAYTKMRKYDDAKATLQHAITVASDTGRTDLISKIKDGLRLLEHAQKPSG